MLNFKCAKTIRNSLFVLIVGLSNFGCGFVFDEQKTMQSAVSHQAAGDYNSAIIELKKILKNNSSNRQARILLAKAYLATGQGAYAEKELNLARKLGTPMTKIAELWAESLLMQNEYGRIFQEVPLSTTNDPKQSANLMLLHGYAYLGQRNKNKAEELFNKARNTQHIFIESEIALGRLAFANNDIDLALKHLNNVLTKNEDNITAWLLKGRVMLVKQSLPEARNSFEKVVKLSTKNQSRSSEFKARVFLVKVALSTKDIDLAKEKVELLKKEFPKHPETKYLSALIDFQYKEYDRARTSLEEVLVVAPKDLQSRLLLGTIHYAKGNYEQANKHLSYFLERVPTYIQARKLLAAVQIKLGRGSDALQSLKEGLDNNINDVDLLAMIGQAAIYSNRPDDAISYLSRAKKSNPGNEGLRTELAKAYLQKGSFDDAIDELKNISGGEAIRAKNMLIYTYLQKRDFKLAKKTANDLVKMSPNQPSVYTMRGIVELATGERAAAQSDFNKSVKYDSAFIPALLALGQMSLEDGKLGLADSYYTKVLQKDRANEKALVGLAMVAEREGKSGQAVKWLEQALEREPRALVPGMILAQYYLKKRNSEKSLDIISKTASFHQDNPKVLSILTRAQLLSGKKHEALKTAKSITIKWPKQVMGYLELARVQSLMQNFKMAESSLQQALKIKPDLLQAKTALFSIYLRTHRTDNALTLGNNVKKQHPKSAIGNMLLGDVYMIKKQYTKAQKEYKQAFAKQQVRDAVNKLSRAYEYAGQKTKAVKILNEWIVKNPDDIKSRMQLAILYTRVNKEERALTHYRYLLEKNPQNVVVLNNLALLLLKSDQEKALTYAEQAHSLQPRIAALTDTYGWVLYNAGQIDKAVQLLEEAAGKNNNPSIQYHYAVALNKIGDKNKAQKILEKLSNKEFDETAEASKLLKSLLK